jgi:ubiquinone/menaquinone biosynthesis C-methylase UbiE
MDSLLRLKNHIFEKAVDVLRLAHETDYRVLDFGCGKSEFLHALAASRLLKFAQASAREGKIGRRSAVYIE